MQWRLLHPRLRDEHGGAARAASRTPRADRCRRRWRSTSAAAARTCASCSAVERAAAGATPGEHPVSAEGAGLDVFGDVTFGIPDRLRASYRTTTYFNTAPDEPMQRWLTVSSRRPGARLRGQGRVRAGRSLRFRDGGRRGARGWDSTRSR